MIKLLQAELDFKYFSRFGDGSICLPNGVPQRISGQVNGVVNDIHIVDQKLHCYVVTENGRTYTAILK